jgi:hypothetical protein
MNACATLEESPKISSNTLVKNEDASLVHVGPGIPFPTDAAFFPIEPDLSGVYYSWRECKRRFVVCIKWEPKKVSFKFDDPEMMKFFKANDFGFKKRENP